jgi:hypothetical protein
MPGLSNGSLYETLENTTQGTGQALVSAIGFNVTCGYLTAAMNSFRDGVWNISLDNVGPLVVQPGKFTSVIRVAPGISYTVGQYTLSVTQTNQFHEQAPNNSIIIYSTAFIVDAEGVAKSPLIFMPEPTYGPNNTIAKLGQQQQIQLLQCFRSLVPQSGFIDSRLNSLNTSLQPSIQKTDSMWRLSTDIEYSLPDTTLLGSDLVYNPCQPICL